jgi:hypothetical protein
LDDSSDPGYGVATPHAWDGSSDPNVARAIHLLNAAALADSELRLIAYMGADP